MEICALNGEKKHTAGDVICGIDQAKCIKQCERKEKGG